MIYSGSSALLYLKLENNWQVIGGMRTTKLILNNQLIDATTNGPWRELLCEVGVRQLNITGAGAFANSEAENNLQRLAFIGGMAKYKLVFGDGNSLSGDFQISHYQRMADINEEENYIISLASSGKIFFLG